MMQYYSNYFIQFSVGFKFSFSALSSVKNFKLLLKHILNVILSYVVDRTSIYGTAVCAYNLTSFDNVFNGPFKYQSDPQMAWNRVPNNSPNMQVPKSRLIIKLIRIMHRLLYYSMLSCSYAVCV